MSRTIVCTVLALLVGATVALAEEVKGKVKNVDADKNTITVTTADGKDHDFKIGTDTKVLAASGKELADRLKDKHIKAGTEVVITTDKDQVKEVKLVKPRPK